MDSKLLDLRNKSKAKNRGRGNSKTSVKSRKSSSRPSIASIGTDDTDPFKLRIFGKAENQNGVSPDLESPRILGFNPFDDVSVNETETKRILFIGDFKLPTSLPISLAATIDMAHEIIDRHEPVWVIVFISILLTTTELQNLVSFMRSRDVYIPIIGNRE